MLSYRNPIKIVPLNKDFRRTSSSEQPSYYLIFCYQRNGRLKGIKIVKDENEKLVDFISASEIEKLNVVAFKKQIESGHEVLSIKDKILYNLLYKEVCLEWQMK